MAIMPSSEVLQLQACDRAEVDLFICICRAGCRPEVEQAAWRLVWLSRDLADDAMAAFTGRLLALVGPLDEHCIAFNRSPGAGQQSALGSKKVRTSLSSPLL